MSFLADASAERNAYLDGQPLLDYADLLLPMQVVLVEALVIQKRDLQTPVEFVLKTVDAGLTKQAEVGEFLGFPNTYTDRLFRSLLDDDYVTNNGSGGIQLSQKGTIALKGDGDKYPVDKTIPFVWDPLVEAIAKQRVDLLRGRTKVAENLTLRIPGSMRPPRLESIDVAVLQRYRQELRDTEEEFDREQVLRLMRVKRTYVRYRPAVLLLFEDGRGGVVGKIAVDEKIDAELSGALMRKEGLKYLGVDRSFRRAGGAQQVVTRAKALDFSKTTTPSLSQVTSRKAVVEWKLKNLRSRLEEEPSDELQQRVPALEHELAVLNAELATLPIRAMHPCEVASYVLQALRNAEREVVLTTTAPDGRRFTRPVQEAMRQASQRGVRIRLFISDRPDDQTNSATAEPSDSLSRLSDLQAKFESLTVSFLTRKGRSIFEVAYDEKSLAFFNDSPLGTRSNTQSLRCFAGFVINAAHVVSQYREEHLSDSSLECVSSVRMPIRQEPRLAKSNNVKKLEPRKVKRQARR